MDLTGLLHVLSLLACEGLGLSMGAYAFMSLTGSV